MNGDHLFHHGWSSKTALWNLMMQCWPPNHSWHLALSCHVLKRLTRNFWGTIRRWMHLIHLHFFCCSLIYPLMAFTHKSTALDPAKEVGWKLCTLQPLLVCWWDDKVRDRQSHKGSPRALSRAALVQVKDYGFEEEAKMCGSNNLQGFYSRICRALNTPPWSLGPLFISGESFQSVDIIQWKHFLIRKKKTTEFDSKGLKFRGSAEGWAWCFTFSA